jgi:predicted lipoprotein with Yx(FWY)xxD motif
MKSLLFTIAAIAVGASLSVGLGSASASTHSSNAAKVALGSSQLGRILVDGRGHTLYLFAKDKQGKSSCTASCAGFWPPLIATGKTLAGGGAKTSLLGTTRRADGRLQVTYNHHPLYTFVKDAGRGQTNGEELNAFGARWYALTAAGAKIEHDNAATPAPAAGGYGSSGTGYGY